MKAIKHKFLDHKINPKTETLIIGTFNPDIEKNPADFFYGRSRNFLWQFLPIAYGCNELKSATKEEKCSFIEHNNIDFADLISEIEVEEGKEANYNDKYIDQKVTRWCNVIEKIEKLKNIKRICFTRKTYYDIPNMKKKILEIENYCKDKKIYFKALTTPARFPNDAKQEEWTRFLHTT